MDNEVYKYVIQNKCPFSSPKHEFYDEIIFLSLNKNNRKWIWLGIYSS